LPQAFSEALKAQKPKKDILLAELTMQNTEYRKIDRPKIPFLTYNGLSRGQT
jgi:hypothetical protein